MSGFGLDGLKVEGFGVWGSRVYEVEVPDLRARNPKP